MEPSAWLARDFGTDPAAGLDGVTVAILERTRLSADGDAEAVRAVLDVATKGSAWRALQLAPICPSGGKLTSGTTADVLFKFRRLGSGVRAETSSTSCDLGVLVNDAAENGHAA